MIQYRHSHATFALDQHSAIVSCASNLPASDQREYRKRENVIIHIQWMQTPDEFEMSLVATKYHHTGTVCIRVLEYCTCCAVGLPALTLGKRDD